MLPCESVLFILTVNCVAPVEVVVNVSLIKFAADPCCLTGVE